MTEYDARLEKIEVALCAALETNPAETQYPLVAPVKNLMRAGGKRWRPLLLTLCAELAAHQNGLSPAGEGAVCALAPLVEFAHTASLIHDDIEDSSETRRGEPAVHIAWGADVALNAASWLYFKAAECLDTAPLGEAAKNALYALYARALRRLHLGQAMDIAWHKDKNFFPSADAYMTMASLKTGTLASFAVQAGLIAGGRLPPGRSPAGCSAPPSPGGAASKPPPSDAAGAAAEKLGAAFQILDDAANLSKGNPGKNRGDDVVEGKKSFVIVTHLKARPEDARAVAGCFEQAGREGIGSPAVERFIALVSASGALDEASSAARAMIAAACAEFASLFPGRQEQARRVTNLFTDMI
jgi:octaprenyl-diphosphate synthase